MYTHIPNKYGKGRQLPINRMIKLITCFLSVTLACHASNSGAQTTTDMQPSPKVSNTTAIPKNLQIQIERTRDASGLLKEDITFLGASGVGDKLSSDQTGKLKAALSGRTLRSEFVTYTGNSIYKQVVTDNDKVELEKKLKDQLRRKLILWTTKTSPECAAAAQTLKQLGVPDDVSLGDLLADTVSTTILIANISEFDKRCLGSMHPPDYPSTAPAWVQAEHPELALGVLRTRSKDGDLSDPFCTALLLSASQLLTARHCFYSRDTSAPIPGRADALAQGNVVLVRATQPTHPLVLRSEAIPPTLISDYLQNDLKFGSFTAERDFIVLELLSPILDAPNIVFRAPVDDEGLWIAGPFVLARVETPSAEPPSQQQDPLSLRWTSATACQVIASSNECLRHTCETVGRYSGAPIFGKPGTDRPSDEITVVGMHLGASGSGGCSDVDNFAVGKGNVGLSGVALKQRGTGWKNN